MRTSPKAAESVQPTKPSWRQSLLTLDAGYWGLEHTRIESVRTSLMVALMGEGLDELVVRGPEPNG